MNAKKIISIVLLSVVFPYLFYNHLLGLNLLIFNLLILGTLFVTNNLNLKNTVNRTLVGGTLLTAFFVLFNGSALAISINILSLFLLAGTNFFPEVRNLIIASMLSLLSFFTSQLAVFTLIQDMASGKKGLSKFLRYLKIIIIPVVVFFLFILIYKEANPVFEGFVKSFFDAMESFFDWVFQNVEFALIMTFVLGILIANYFILGSMNNSIAELDYKSSIDLDQEKLENITTSKATALKSEYKSAIIMFASLNILIMVVNIIDISWVWFGFEWNGEYLKQFVHEGTYLLILSIFISLAISIFYFRGNINFLKNNDTLKKLAYAWLIQNAVMTISVGIRNFWYIYYFALAYKRIGVIFFLILTLFSIYTVYQKINKKKTTFYLFSINSLATYVILVIMAFFNWDVIIAKYNFSHTQSAFVHFDFLAKMSNNAIPYLEKSKAELDEIDHFQEDDFPFRKQYITSEKYAEKIEIKKANFMNNWPNRDWQEWNLAGERAYRSLKAKK